MAAAQLLDEEEAVVHWTEGVLEKEPALATCVRRCFTWIGRALRSASE